MLDDEDEYRKRISWGFDDKNLPQPVDRTRVTWSATWWAIVFGVAALAAVTLAIIE